MHATMETQATMDDQAWQPREALVFTEMDDCVALLDTDRNVYYAIEGIGPFVWQKLSAGLDFAAICEAISETYDIDPATARADLAELIAGMTDAGLIVARHG